MSDLFHKYITFLLWELKYDRLLKTKQSLAHRTRKTVELMHS